MKRLSITLTDSQAAALERMSAETGATKQSMIGLAISAWIRENDVLPEDEPQAPQNQREGLAGWYGWARLLGKDGHVARDVERQMFATETEAIEHAREVVHSLKESGADAYELWEECKRCEVCGKPAERTSFDDFGVKHHVCGNHSISDLQKPIDLGEDSEQFLAAEKFYRENPELDWDGGF